MLEIKDAEVEIKTPKKKDIFLSGTPRGDITPTLYGGCLNWHAVIRIECNGAYGVSLLQGHGPTPHKAIANAVCMGRKYQEEFFRELNRVERELGTLGKPDEEILGTIA